MKKRIRDHIVPPFNKHGMTVVGFWTAAHARRPENTLAYMLAYPSREAAKKSWDGFRSEPQRARVWTATAKDGPINLKVESMYIDPIDFSPVKSPVRLIGAIRGSQGGATPHGCWRISRPWCTCPVRP